MADILRRYGYSVSGDLDDEFAVERGTDSFPYYVDLCASNGTRVLVIEIDGHTGHSNRRRILHDTHRTNDIKALIKDIEVFRFAFWQLAKCPDDLIAEELGILPRATTTITTKTRDRVSSAKKKTARLSK